MFIEMCMYLIYQRFIHFNKWEKEIKNITGSFSCETSDLQLLHLSLWRKGVPEIFFLCWLTMTWCKVSYLSVFRQFKHEDFEFTQTNNVWWNVLFLYFMISQQIIYLIYLKKILFGNNVFCIYNWVTFFFFFPTLVLRLELVFCNLQLPRIA